VAKKTKQFVGECMSMFWFPHLCSSFYWNTNEGEKSAQKGVKCVMKWGMCGKKKLKQIKNVIFKAYLM